MSLTSQLPALQVVVPLLTAPLVVLLRGPGLAWAAATAASVMSFAIAIALTAEVLASGTISYDMSGWPGPYGITLRFDQGLRPDWVPDSIRINGVPVTDLILGRLGPTVSARPDQVC